MHYLKHKVSNSQSKNDRNSVKSINGTDTFLSRFGKTNSFDSNFTFVIDDIKAKIQKIDELKQNIDQSNDDSQKYTYLDSENKLLRKSLLQMNEYLNKFLIVVKEQKLRKTGSMSYKYGSDGRLKQSREQKIICKDLEQDNYKKMISNLHNEHSRLKQRLDKVQDIKYIRQLKTDINKSKNIIKKLTDHNRGIEVYQVNKEKKLEEVIKRGKNDAMNEVSKLITQLTVLQERNFKLDKEIEFQNKNEIEIDDNTEKTIAKLGHAESDARKLEIDIKNPENESLTSYNPEAIIIRKKKVEKHSINAISRKFHAKILIQKERLDRVISKYNTNLKTHKEVIESVDPN